jgi:hypothetical protein
MKNIFIKSAIVTFCLVATASIAGASFMVDVYSSPTYINSLSKAEAAMSGTPDYQVVTDVIDFRDDKDKGGHFNTNYSFGVDSLDTFVLHATTFLNIENAGKYTFGTNSDDGVKLSIDGLDIINNGAPHNNEDDFYTYNFSSPGTFKLDLLFYENYGGASIELFAASGTYKRFHKKAFTLIGSEYGLSTSAAPVPEPATMILFGAGLAGLMGVSRKRRK